MPYACAACIVDSVRAAQWRRAGSAHLRRGAIARHERGRVHRRNAIRHRRHHHRAVVCGSGGGRGLCSGQHLLGLLARAVLTEVGADLHGHRKEGGGLAHGQQESQQQHSHRKRREGSMVSKKVGSRKPQKGGGGSWPARWSTGNWAGHTHAAQPHTRSGKRQR
eukprot:358234-Chlamydomonas_euryale.AAC.2